MSDNDLQARLSARLAAQRQQPPLEVARSFLRQFCSDALNLEEVRQDLLRTRAVNLYSLEEGLAAIEALITAPLSEEGTLFYLVSWDANQDLDDDPTDEGAKAWLKQLAELVRAVLGQEQPPRSKAYLPAWFPGVEGISGE